jgi:hypothetical protein
VNVATAVGRWRADPAMRGIPVRRGTTTFHPVTGTPGARRPARPARGAHDPRCVRAGRGAAALCGDGCGGQRPVKVHYRARGAGRAAPPPVARVPITPRRHARHSRPVHLDRRLRRIPHMSDTVRIGLSSNPDPARIRVHPRPATMAGSTCHQPGQMAMTARPMSKVAVCGAHQVLCTSPAAAPDCRLSCCYGVASG